MDQEWSQADVAVEDLIREIAGQWQITQREVSDEEIIDRLILALVNEGAAILEEGIAARPSDIDTVYLNGYGFPAWRGGPMFFADHLGLETIIQKLNDLAAYTGDTFWQPAALLLRLEAEGSTLGSLN